MDPETGWLDDEEIAQVALESGRRRGCTCPSVEVTIVHLIGMQVVSANVSHQDKCPLAMVLAAGTN